MALLSGDTSAANGMSKAIFEEMDRYLSPPLIKAIEDAKDDDVKESAIKALQDARDGWRKLSYCIAKGVIDHIKANMEVFGVETQGNIRTSVVGNTGSSPPNNHYHSVNLSGVEEKVTFVQSNDGTGRVR